MLCYYLMDYQNMLKYANIKTELKQRKFYETKKRGGNVTKIQ